MFHWWNEINQEDFICFELCSSTVPSRYYSKKSHLKDSIYFWMYILILAAQQQIISKCHICSSSCSGSKLWSQTSFLSFCHSQHLIHQNLSSLQSKYMQSLCTSLHPHLLQTPAVLSSFQFSSVTQSCPILCNPMECSMPGFPVLHQLPEPTQTHVHSVGNTIQPSHPLSFPSPPTFNLSQHQSLFQWVSSSHHVPKVLKFQLQHQSLNEYSGLISFRIGWLNLLAVQGTQEYSPAPQFKSVTSIYDYWKNHSFD